MSSSARPVANRARASVRETMGYCAGIAPLRGRVDANRSFADHLQQTHAMTVDAFANAMPFAELARALGEAAAPGFNPVFEVRFALQNHPVPEFKLPTLSACLKMRSTGTPRFQLGCEITEEGEQLEVVWLFRETVISAQEMESLNDAFQRILEGAAADPDRVIADIKTPSS